MSYSKIYFTSRDALKKEIDSQRAVKMREATQWRKYLEIQGIATKRYDVDFKTHPATASYFSEMIAFGKSPKGNIILSGKCGTGKTHVAIGLFAAHMHFNGPGARFCKSESIYREWVSKSRDGHLNDYFERLCDSPVLFIDDLGQGEITESYKKFLYSVIDDRWQAAKPTVVTTNLIASEFADLFGDAILSRLADGKHWKFTGKDYRLEQAREENTCQSHRNPYH